METGYEKPDKKACLWLTISHSNELLASNVVFFTQNLKVSKIATYLFLYA